MTTKPTFIFDAFDRVVRVGDTVGTCAKHYVSGGNRRSLVIGVVTRITGKGCEVKYETKHGSRLCISQPDQTVKEPYCDD